MSRIFLPIGDADAHAENSVLKCICLICLKHRAEIRKYLDKQASCDKLFKEKWL